MRDGVIFVATGMGYLELAQQAARSLRATNPGLPVDLFTDMVDADENGIFDQVHPVPSSHPRVKIECLPLARFERVLFLDCDVLVLADLSDLFDLTDRFALSLAHDVRRRSELIREGHAVQTPYAFPSSTLASWSTATMPRWPRFSPSGSADMMQRAPRVIRWC